jgi:hypothetical protein
LRADLQKAAAILVVAALILTAGCAGRRPAGEVAAKEFDLLEALDRTQNYVDRRRPKYHRFTRLLQDIEDRLQDLRRRPDRNMTFFLAAEDAFESWAQAQAAWSRLVDDDDPRGYHRAVLLRHFQDADRAVRRARRAIAKP